MRALTKYEALIGARRGHLTIMSFRRHPERPRLMQLVCVCDCGQEAYRLKWNLTDASSCGHCGKRRMGDKIPYSLPEPEYSRRKAEVIVANVIKTERGCWEYQGFRTPHKGYGQIGVKNSRNEHTHRVVYRGLRGPIPEGWDVCHTCDNPPCCNPLHLFAAPRVANLIDMRNKGRNRQTQKTHCPHGHAYAEHGYSISTRPTWCKCRQCDRDKMRREQADGTALARQRRYRARKRAERFQSGKS